MVMEIPDTRNPIPVEPKALPHAEPNQPEQNELADTATVQEIGERLIKKHLQAFMELAKLE